MADSIRKGVSPALVWGALACVAALLSLHLALPRIGGSALDQALLLYGIAPRIATALVAGAALGLSGALLQSALDNPLAEPATLGVFAGAQLALGIAAVLAPALGALGREAAALAGGLGAAALVLALAWRRRLDPVTVVLCGMVVATVASSLSAALILARGDYLFALLIWGGGALAQEGWRPAATLAVVLAAGALAAVALRRPLGALAAGEAAARGLGAPVAAIRLSALGVGVLLATTVAAEVGLIAFVGLAAPTLARLGGARTQGRRLAASAALGALTLWLADGLVQHLGQGEAIPTGAATALLGAPLLLWLLPRIPMADRPVTERIRRAGAPLRVVGLFALFAGLALAAALALGRGPDGWTLAQGFGEALPFRLPRTAAAAAAGAMFAAAGVLLQRITGNPLAGPEVLGVGAGAGAGLAVALVAAGATSLPAQLLGAGIGAAAALALMLALAGGGRLGPERMLLAGAAIAALCLAGLNAVIATGSPAAFRLLAWITGATDAVGPGEALAACAVAVALIAPLPLLLRPLDILPLGSAVASGLGLPVPAARIGLAGLAALLTAAAALVAGPLSFVGLVAPHVAFASGLTRPGPHLAGAVLAGAGLMTAADLLARTIVFPYQLPLGLFASLLGGAYLIFALRTR